jgi:5,6-dimethylbenzimidazole synthase
MSYSAEEKNAIYRVIRERRDMRHFNQEPVDPEILYKLILAAQQAPSVGYMQPWRFIRISDHGIQMHIYEMVKAEIAETAEHTGSKKGAFMNLKLEGLRECAEVWVAALMDGREQYVLGRRTMPEMDIA